MSKNPDQFSNKPYQFLISTEAFYKKNNEISDARKAEIKTCITNNIEGILAGTYTLENLLKDLKTIDKPRALYDFLRANFSTTKLEEIVETLTGKKANSGTSVSGEVLSRTEIEQLISDVKKRVFALYNSGKNRTETTAEITSLVESGELPNKKILLRIFKAKSLTDMCKLLYSQWEFQKLNPPKPPKV